MLISLSEFQAVTRSQSIYTPEILKILDLLKNSITQMHFVGKGYLFFSNSHELIALSGVEIHLMLPAWAPMISFSNGPRIEPCGTPEEISAKEEE